MRRALALALFVAAPAVAEAWGAATHRQVAALAWEGIPPGSRGSEAARRRFLVGAVAPDRWGDFGGIPARAHVLHAGDGGHEGMAAVVPALEVWLRRRRGRRDAAWWFQAGRLAHLIADLAQPMHTAQTPAEAAVHARYERMVDRLAWAPVERQQAGPRRGLRGREPLPLRALARLGRAEYPALLAAAAGKLDVGRTRRYRARAVREVRRRLRGVLAGRASPEGEGGAGWRWLAFAWAWLVGLWARGLRVRPLRRPRPRARPPAWPCGPSRSARPGGPGARGAGGPPAGGP